MRARPEIPFSPSETDLDMPPERVRGENVSTTCLPERPNRPIVL